MKRAASHTPPSVLSLPALVLCLTPLIALPAFAAEADAALAAKPLPASRAVFDKESNRLRAPEADEPSPAATRGAAAARSAVPQSMLRSPNAFRFQAQTMHGRDGAETRRLDLSRSLRFSVAHRHADGSLHKDCVVSEEGVHAHLNPSTVATVGESTNGGNRE